MLIANMYMYTNYAPPPNYIMVWLKINITMSMRTHEQLKFLCHFKFIDYPFID